MAGLRGGSGRMLLRVADLVVAAGCVVVIDLVGLVLTLIFGFDLRRGRWRLGVVGRHRRGPADQQRGQRGDERRAQSFEPQFSPGAWIVLLGGFDPPRLMSIARAC